jgi:hypothetical protein
MDSEQKNTMSNCATKQTKYISIEVCKIFTGMLFLLSFFLPTSILFTLVISTAIGSSYYLLCETQPQFMMMISIILKYQVNKLKHKYNKWTSSFTKDSKIRLQKDDNFIFLEYYDMSGVNNHKKYIYLFDQKLRSNDVIIFKDELDNDITSSLEPYLGPMQNFHGVPITPGDFNHKKIKIFRDGDICMSKIFEENEPLIMK